MIRRDLNTTDGATKWLLISQLDHADISGELASRWTAADLSAFECDGGHVPDATTDEVLAAITLHDNGWQRWEMMPQLDPAHGRPYSFMNELPLEDSLRIWSESVMSARRIGPLAGWMVASHFSELLQDGNHANDDRAARWLHTMHHQRSAWLAEWQRASDSNATLIAERALRLLQACDFLSLWLCCDCPVAADEAPGQIEPFVLHWPEHGIGPYGFTAQRVATRSSKTSNPFAEPGWLISGTPWPFDAEELRLSGAAWIAPALRYASGQELLDARRPVKLRWKLVRQSSR